MTSGDSGYRIGFKELYELVIQVSTKLDTITGQQATQIQANTSRIEGMSKGMQMMWKELQEADKELERKLEAKEGATWQVNLAIAGSTISLLTALAGIIIK